MVAEEPDLVVLSTRPNLRIDNRASLACEDVYGPQPGETPLRWAASLPDKHMLAKAWLCA